MVGFSSVRTYGRRPALRPVPGVLFPQLLPVSPTDRRRRLRNKTLAVPDDDPVAELTEQLTFVTLDEVEPETAVVVEELGKNDSLEEGGSHAGSSTNTSTSTGTRSRSGFRSRRSSTSSSSSSDAAVSTEAEPLHDEPVSFFDSSSFYDDGDSIESGLRVLAWSDLCPAGDRIEKIAEASYAEVYRVSNARGTSIIKAIRLASAIRPQTKAQVRAGLVDEEPHDEADLRGELAISEWLAAIPGFVVYKERYIVRGRAPAALLATHQAFQRRARRQDPGRLQFYPSPSRYLDDTRFLVIELGDAGHALEDFVLDAAPQLWDIFLLVAIALARAEDQLRFEHRDLHEGNLCIRRVGDPRNDDDSHRSDDSTAAPPPPPPPGVVFGRSGLDITILDYGLSRADDGGGSDDDDDDDDDDDAIAFDLEKDLSLFTSTHAAQCRVYRRMRSYLLKGDRVHLPPACHQQPYDVGPDGRPISWKQFHPYTNVLWLAYLYDYLVRRFSGDRRALAAFRRATRELWHHMNPDAPPAVLSFASATDIVRFAVEAGWLTETQLASAGCDGLDRTGPVDGGGGGGGCPSTYDDTSCCGDESIIKAQSAEPAEAAALRRSPRRRRPTARYC